ncbi:Salmolysin [Candidatus Rubidus massiliensis]|nr:Salmolysin [Candidatus Rubidus massiliensis]
MHKKTKISSLKSHIGYQLRLLSNQVSYNFFRKLDELDVTVAEWVILRELYAHDEDPSPCDVAKKTGLTRGAISKLIDRLLNKKLITRSENLKDRRYQKIKLTHQALKLIPKLAELADQNDELFFGVLSKEEREQFMNFLLKLSQIHQLNNIPIQ